MSQTVFDFAVGGHLPQLVTLLDEESQKESGAQPTPVTLLPDPTTAPPRPSPFVQAAYKGRLEVVQYLVHRYPTLDFINHTDTVHFESHGASLHHCTALSAAALGGHTEVARVLLEAGASTEIEDCTGATPLGEAVFHNHPDLVRLLHEDYGACIDAPNVFGWSPLHVAIDQGHVAVIDYLLDRGGASITQTTPEGFTALHIAAMRGRKSVVKKLLDMHQSLEEAGGSKRNVIPESQPLLQSLAAEERVPSPLYLAAANSRHSVLELLRKQTEIPEACWRDVKLLQGAVRLERGLDPRSLWGEAMTAAKRAGLSSSCRTTADDGTENCTAVEAYEQRKEMQCHDDLCGLDLVAVSPHELGVWGGTPVESLCQVEKRYQALLIRERCIGSRDPEIFWQLSKLAEALWHRARDDLLVPDWEAVWRSVLKIWLRAIELYDNYQLQSLERGHLLPQSVEAELGRWGSEYLAPGLSLLLRNCACVDPEFTRYTEFLLKALATVKQRSQVLRAKYMCEETTPLSLVQALLLVFRAWIVFNALPCPPSRLASASVRLAREMEVRKCEQLGERFVSECLYLPNGSTLLCEVVAMWFELQNQPLLECGVGVESEGMSPLHCSNELLLRALLAWGADEVINVPTPPRGDTPVHYLCSAVCEGNRLNSFTRLIPVLVNGGAHLDAVNKEGEIPYMMLLCGMPTYAINPDIAALLRPPIPPRLSCLVCHRILVWGMAYAQLNCLPDSLIQFIRLHDRNRSTYAIGKQ